MVTWYFWVSSLVKWLEFTLVPFQRSMVQSTAGRPQCHEKPRQSIRTNFKHLLIHHILAGCASVWHSGQWSGRIAGLVGIGALIL